MSEQAVAFALKEWQDEMDRRGRLACKFVCPSCGHEASPADFKAAGADPQRAPQECIGRVDSKLGGCDWAAFGLFDICTVHVDTGDKKIAVFAFAEAPHPQPSPSPS
jgi:hypothetical protein